MYQILKDGTPFFVGTEQEIRGEMVRIGISGFGATEAMNGTPLTHKGAAYTIRKVAGDATGYHLDRRE